MLRAALLALVTAAAPGAAAGAEQPIGDKQAAIALLARVLEAREQIRPLEAPLRYDQLVTTESLDAERRVRSVGTALYEYRPVAGFHLWKLRELDGEPIRGRRLTKEEQRFQKAIENAHRQVERDREAAERGDADHEPVPRNGMDLFYEIVADAIELDMFDGELLEETSWRGRPMQVVRFRPRPGFSGAPNRMLTAVSRCAGELWVDSGSLQIARVRAELIQRQNFLAGLFGRLYEGTRADVESEFDGRRWLPQRVTLTVDARVFFFRRIRRRVHYDFLDFRTDPAADTESEKPVPFPLHADPRHRRRPGNPAGG